jgi:hypothetical protein
MSSRQLALLKAKERENKRYNSKRDKTEEETLHTHTRGLVTDGF